MSGTMTPQSIELILIPSARRRASDRVASEARMGDRLICTSDQPLFDGARVLLAEGFAPETALTTRWAGSPHVAMQSTIGEAAKWTVWETDDGPVFARYRPMDRERVESKRKS